MIADTIVKKDGTNQLVGLANVSLPDVERAAEEIKGLGIATYEEVLPIINSAMTTTLSWIEMNPGMYLAGALNTALIISAAIAGTESSTHINAYKKLVATVKGKFKKKAGGELGAASKNNRDDEIATTYYKLEIDGQVVHEIDTLNSICICNGEDLYAELAKNLQ